MAHYGAKGEVWYERVGEPHAVARAAENVLNMMNFELMRKTFRHCGYPC